MDAELPRPPYRALVSESTTATGFELPTSGELLGFLAVHLGLQEEFSGDSTAQRAFRGERVKPDSVRELVTTLVGSLWSRDLATAIGLAEDQRREHTAGVVELLVQLLQDWDARLARLHVNLRPDEVRHVYLPLLRLTALDVGLRLGAYAWMERLPEPARRAPPSWTHEDGFGRKLDEMMAATKAAKKELRSRADLAEAAGVSANTMSAWSRCQMLPSGPNIERLAEVLADRLPDVTRAELQYALRVYLCLCWGRKALSEKFGDDIVPNLIDGGLWVAERVYALARTHGSPHESPMLASLVGLGARSELGHETVELLASEAPNPFLRLDLLALHSENWTPRLRWWLPFMMDGALPPDEVRSFFPVHDLETLTAEVLTAGEPALVGALAGLAFGARDFARAAQLWERAVQLDPANAQSHYNFATALHRAYRDSREALERALHECRIAAGLDEQAVEPRIEIGVLLIDLGHLEEAIGALTQVKEHAAMSAGLEYHWGLALMKLGRDDEAVHHYTEATRLQPTYVDAWANLSFVLNRMGRKREAREAAKRAEFLGHSDMRITLDNQRGKEVKKR